MFKFALTTFIALIFAYFSLRNLDWPAFWVALKDCEFYYLPLVFFCLFLTHFFRAARWQLMLRSKIRLRLPETFAIHSLGFFAIFILPFRLGEFVRPWALKKKRNVSMPFSLATVVVERVLDGLVAMILLGLGIWGSATQSSVEVYGGLSLSQILGTAAAFFGVIVLILTFWSLLYRYVSKRLQRRFESQSQESIWHKGEAMLRYFSESLVYLHFGKRLFWLSFLYSFAVWGVAVLAYYFLGLAFGFSLTLYGAALVLGIVTLGLMIPGPPGFIGNFHFFIQGALILLGINKSEGFAYATVLYVVNMSYIFLSGFWGMGKLSLTLGGYQKELKKDA